MAHSIVVDLLMRTGAFETDAKRAERALKKFEKQAVDTGKVVGAALAAGAVAAAYAFDSLVKSAADFKDLEETTGAQAEDLASLAVAAGTAGVEMQTLAGNAIRLTKSLTGVDDDSKAAGAALKALGLDVKAFKQLDPVAQIDALSAAFAGFADGPQKSAVAVALWGKSGAEMIKVLKALEEQGGRTKILTQEQIEAADAYADAQAKASTELKLYAQAAATQALPAFNALTEAAGSFVKGLFDVNAESGKLGQSQGIRDFATGAVRAMAFVIDIADGAIRVLRGVGLAYGAVAAAAVSVASGEFTRARNIIGLLGDDLDALAQRKFFSQSVDEALKGTGQAAPVTKPTKQKLRFDGVSDSKGAKKEIDRAADAIKALNREIQVFGQESDTLSKTLAFQDLKPTIAQLEQYKAGLASLEQLRAAEAVQTTLDALVQERDALSLSKEQITARDLALKGATGTQVEFALEVLKSSEAIKAQKDLMEEGKRLAEQMRTPLEELLAEYERLNKLFAAGAIDATTYRRAVESAQDAFSKIGEEAKKASSDIDEFAKNAAENIQRSFGDTLVDAMNGNWKSIGDGFKQMLDRMIAEALAAQITRSLFGDSGKGGGLLGDVLPALGGLLGFGGARADGGDVAAGRSYLVGERGPEMFVPRTAGTVLPSVKDQMRAAGRSVSVSNTFVMPPGGYSRDTQQQIAATTARSVERASARNN